jgi:EAL domain-containing protein (putative c-di-GMP-specific phosphodiesterase class I)
MPWELGVHLVQGFYLHRPQSASSPIVPHVATA